MMKWDHLKNKDIRTEINEESVVIYKLENK